MAILAFPFWLILLLFIGPLVYHEDRGCILYKSPRLGKDGKVFYMYKFRSMKMNAQDIRNEDHSTFNGKADKRVTKIGRILRKTSIDETPQIINVLKNEMSWIGPRPDLPDHIQYLEGGERKKLAVLPGITGYNQAYFRNLVSWKERLKNDVYYVEHLSFWLDVRIFIKTMKGMLIPMGIYNPISEQKLNKLEGENFRGKALAWDTKYFGVDSASVSLRGVINQEGQRQILNFCKEYEFITIRNINNRKENNHWIGMSTKAVLMDMNIQFEKTIKNAIEYKDNFMEVYEKCPRNEEVLRIAQRGFLYSRFFNDEKIPKNLSKDIYFHWTEGSFKKENRFFILVRRQEKVAGFILFSIHKTSKTAIIELISVDEEYRGQKVGKSLILGMESYISKNGVNKIKVGTQVDNIPAIEFYVSAGFHYIGCSSVYHLWREGL